MGKDIRCVYSSRLPSRQNKISITLSTLSVSLGQVLTLSRGSTAAAAAAKSLYSCPTLCNPRDSSPPGSPIPGILQARTLEWVAISFSKA